MKLTKKYLKTLRNNNKSFRDWVINDIINSCSAAELKSHISDINKYGCVSGCVPSLIYHTDTKKVFTRHFEEILKIVETHNKDIGTNQNDLHYNKLVWLAYEIIASELAYDL